MFYTTTPYEKLSTYGKHLDRKKKLLYIPIGAAITNLTRKYAHNILVSFEYSLYLLFVHPQKNKVLAEEIITEALKYQNLNKNSSYFGYWDYFSEEKIEDSPPNIAQSSGLGLILFQLLQKYGDILSENLRNRLLESCINTTFSFVSQYNQQNPITLLQTVALSILCGETYDKPEFVNYGEQVLETFYKTFLHSDSLYEYNDTYYEINTLNLLSFILANVKSKLCIDICKHLNDVRWENLATHYHHKTMQISGPFSFAQSDCLNEHFYNFLYVALNKKIPFPHTSLSLWVSARCPEKYYPFFEGKQSIEFSQKVVSKGMVFPHFRSSIVSSVYIRPDYTLGTASREFFWKMRRPFIGYFGEINDLFCFKLEVLHDFESYSSAVLHSVQQKGHVLGHISFILNKGDKHISLDAPNPQIQANDFRIRFSVSGKVDALKITHSNSALEVSYNDINLYYEIPFVKIDGYETKCRFSENDNAIYFDTIIHSGENTTINFSEMENAIFEFVFLITSSKKRLEAPINSITDGTLETFLNAENITLGLQTPLKPGYESVCFVFDRQLINDIQLEEYVTQVTGKFNNYLFIEKTNRLQPIDIPISIPEKKDSELSDKIEQLQFYTFENLSEAIEDICKLLEKVDYSLVLKKRLAIQIAVNIFENAKNNNYAFREIIDRRHSDIFRQITVAENFETIYKTLIGFYTFLQNESLLKNQDSIIIQDAINFIDDNLLNPELSLNFVANSLGYSTSYISRLFIKTTKMNYIEYVQKQKLQYAIEQLKTGKMTIKEISDKIGYSNPNSFMRMFRQIMGITVGQYLEQNE